MRVKRLVFGALLLGATLGSFQLGCGNPCENMWKKLNNCAKNDTEKKFLQSAESKQSFIAACKKSDKSLIKSCLKLKDCDALRRCASKSRGK